MNSFINHWSQLAILLFIFISSNSYAQNYEQWIEDLRNGCKVFNKQPQPNETITYDGQCLNGYADGKGVVIWYKDQLFNEKGDAHWTHGKLDGKGSYEWASGNKFVGEWVNGNRHGKGVFTWANGNKYVGDFLDGKRTGKGTFTWANGDRYVGDFYENLRTGKGIYIWATGGKYEGNFIDGKFSGEGTKYSETGNVLKEGFWEKSELIRAYKLKSNEQSPKLKFKNPSSQIENTIKNSSANQSESATSGGLPPMK